MTKPAFSVIVVSHGRPESLLWSLSALDGQLYPAFEIIVVADPDAAARVRAAYGPRVKLVEHSEANISAARNLGVAQAAGEIIAFIDDDAAAEPMWLAHLAGAFEAHDVSAAGGYVIGRNGISFQWTAREIGAGGRAHPLAPDGPSPSIATPSAGRAVKTEGTNMAVRADVLRELGGFDEAFHFFLDETDLNWRLAEAGHQTALAPLAQVHHAYRASARRDENRRVRDLFDVGASSVLYLRKTGAAQAGRLEEIRAEQSERLRAQVAKGLHTEASAAQVLQRLEEGFDEGARRETGSYARFDSPPPAFLPFKPQRTSSCVMSGAPIRRATLLKNAQEAADKGANVSLFLFGLNARFHHVRYAEGVWVQTGGVFGKSTRTEPLLSLQSRSARLAREIRRIAKVRGLDGET